MLPDILLEKLAGRSLLSAEDMGSEAWQKLIDFALDMKRGAVDPGRPLEGKTMSLVFFNSSLRTRSSMSVAVHQLGGYPLVLDIGGGVWGLETRQGVVMDGDRPEHIREAIPVLARYADYLGVRCFPGLEDYAEDRLDPVLSSIRDLSPVPVLNLESSLYHPCQSLADMMTVVEKKGSLRGRRLLLSWAWHPKALPMAVPNSFAQAAALCGADLTIAAPPEFALDPELTGRWQNLARENGGDLRLSTEADTSYDDVEVVYAKSWGSLQHYGRTEDEKACRDKYRHWIVNEERMQRTADGIFMHCLPVRRNVVVTDGVIDSPASVVIDEAENRLHGQKAVLAAMAAGRN